MSTIQNFYRAEILAWRTNNEKISENKMDELYVSLETVFPNASILIEVDHDDEGDYAYITLKPNLKEEAYYQFECSWATSYNDTQDMIEAIWKCPAGWTWELNEQDFEEPDDIEWKEIEQINEETFIDWAYEKYIEEREEKLLANL